MNDPGRDAEAAHPGLREALTAAHRRGDLGGDDVDAHIRHATGFGLVAEAQLGGPPPDFVDLGTGGGVPGLVLALRWPAARGLLVEVARRRAEDLRGAVEALGIAARVRIAVERAETVARDPDWRERATVVTARGFAAPAVTAEVAAGLVSVGGVAIVSEPPGGDRRRWPTGDLSDLGFEPAEWHQASGATFAVLRKAGPAPGNVPRRPGLPEKRPRW